MHQARGIVTRLHRDGWTFHIEDPVEVPASYRRYVCGRDLYYHGRIEVSGRDVYGWPTRWATPNREVHMDTLVTVFNALWPNHAVWQCLRDGTKVTHIFGPDRSLDSE